VLARSRPSASHTHTHTHSHTHTHTHRVSESLLSAAQCQTLPKGHPPNYLQKDTLIASSPNPSCIISLQSVCRGRLISADSVEREKERERERKRERERERERETELSHIPRAGQSYGSSGRN